MAKLLIVPASIDVLNEHTHIEDYGWSFHIPFIYHHSPGNELHTSCYDLGIKSSICKTLSPWDPADVKLAHNRKWKKHTRVSSFKWLFSQNRIMLHWKLQPCINLMVPFYYTNTRTPYFMLF